MPTRESWIIFLSIAKIAMAMFIIILLLKTYSDEKKRKKQFNRNGRHYKPESFAAPIRVTCDGKRTNSDIYGMDETPIGEYPHPPGRQFGVARSSNEAFPPWQPQKTGRTRSMYCAPKISIDVKD